MANAVAIFTPGQRITDTEGTPYANCRIDFFEANTEAPKVVYADPDLTVPLGTSVYTDAAGYPVTSQVSTVKTLVYATSDRYKVRGVDSDGVTIFEHADCKGAVVEGTTVSGSFLTQAAGDVRYMRNPNALAAVTNVAAGDKFGLYSAAAAGNRNIDWSDLSADLLSEWRTAGHLFAAGAATIVFQQTAAPAGWTKVTTHNNKALRIVSGTAASGGTVDFTTAFAAARATTVTVSATTLTESQIPAHDHVVSIDPMYLAGGTTGPAIGGGGAASGVNYTSASAGGGTSHTHAASGTVNLDVRYVDVILAVKA